MYLMKNKNKIWDFAKIHSAIPDMIYTPHTIPEIIKIIKAYPNHKICIAGSKYSHGGQTLLDDSLYLDFSQFNKIVNFDYDNKLITVQAGATWEQIINYLDQFDLSVSEMQSYYNFSVGGSISVNCHGRGLLYGTVGDSVESLVVLTSQGKLILTDRKRHPELFKAVIGGYGGIAIIILATLKITENFPLERKIITIEKQSLDKFYDNLKNSQI